MFTEKKNLPNVILMYGTFRYVLSHIKYKVSLKIPPGGRRFLRYNVFSCRCTSDWIGD